MLLHKSKQRIWGLFVDLNLIVNRSSQWQKKRDPAINQLPGTLDRPCAETNPEKAKQYEITSFVSKKKPVNALSQFYPYLTMTIQQTEKKRGRNLACNEPKRLENENRLE